MEKHSKETYKEKFMKWWSVWGGLPVFCLAAFHENFAHLYFNRYEIFEIYNAEVMNFNRLVGNIIGTVFLLAAALALYFYKIHPKKGEKRKDLADLVIAGFGVKTGLLAFLKGLGAIGKISTVSVGALIAHIGKLMIFSFALLLLTISAPNARAQVIASMNDCDLVEIKYWEERYIDFSKKREAFFDGLKEALGANQVERTYAVGFFCDPDCETARDEICKVKQVNEELSVEVFPIGEHYFLCFETDLDKDNAIKMARRIQLMGLKSVTFEDMTRFISID